MLSVTPVLQPPQPPRHRRPLQGGRAGHRQAGPALQHPLAHGARTCPTTCWPSSAQIDRIDGVKQANDDNLAPIDGLEIYAGNDDTFARTLDLGGAGGILVATHIVGDEMRRMVDEPDRRAEIDAVAAGRLRGARRDDQPDPGQGRAATCSAYASARLRLPIVEADESERRRSARCSRPRALVGATA